MSNRNVGNRRVSGQQLDILWEYLNSHRDIAVSYNRSLQVKEYFRRKWQEVTEILNAQGAGAHKDWKSWSKYWIDYKAKLKRRVAALRLSQRRTGGGPSTEPPLSDLENKFLQILGEDYGQGLSGVRVEPFPVCDANMNITSVDASYGGASHPFKAHLENLSETENIWFLGDSGYPLRKTMITPVLDAAPNSPEAHYTNFSRLH